MLVCRKTIIGCFSQAAEVICSCCSISFWLRALTQHTPTWTYNLKDWGKAQHVESSDFKAAVLSHFGKCLKMMLATILVQFHAVNIIENNSKLLKMSEMILTKSTVQAKKMFGFQKKPWLFKTWYPIYLILENYLSFINCGFIFSIKV